MTITDDKKTIHTLNIFKITIVSLAVKVIYYLCFYILHLYTYNRLDYKYLGQYFFTSYFNNDSGWYQKIAENGYPIQHGFHLGEQSVYAFFPLYPFIVHFLEIIFRINSEPAFFLATTLISLMCFIIFYKFLIQIGKNTQVALITTIVLLVFPHNYYFSMYYTEGLFLLLLLLSYYFVNAQKRGAFILVSSLLVLTKVSGIVMFLPLAIYFIEKNGLSLRNRLGAFRFIQLFTPMVVTFFLYCVFLFVKTGDFFAFKTAAEYGWGGKHQLPFTTIYKSIFTSSSPWYLKYNAVYSFVFLLLSVALLAKKQISYGVLTLLVILLPLSEGSSISQPRFISVLFPFVIMGGDYINSTKYKYSILFLSFIFQLLLLYFWSINHPFSF